MAHKAHRINTLSIIPLSTLMDVTRLVECPSCGNSPQQGARIGRYILRDTFIQHPYSLWTALGELSPDKA
ncbi:hypothetical protein Holit_03185 [Hollandina sp. SP2]